MRLGDLEALEEAVQGAINIMESHGISMIAASVPLAIIKGAPTIDATPLEWLRNQYRKYMQNNDKLMCDAYAVVIGEWQDQKKEQEAQDG